MTLRRDPIGDRPAPEAPSPGTTTVGTRPLALSGVELLAAFAATVARYLDSSSITVAWADHGAADRRWRRVDLEVDFNEPFAVLLGAGERALATTPDDPAGALPTFGVTAGPLPDGPGPALLAFEAGTGQVVVAADAYREDDVRRFADHLATLAGARTSGLPVGRLPLVSDAERDRLVPTSIALTDDRTLVDLIRDRVLADPDALAVRAAGRSLTYAELWQRSGALAAQLPPRVLVGVWADRSVDQMVGLVGVLRVGSAYVALEPTYPAARLRTVKELAHLTHVAAGADLQPGHENALAELGLDVLRTVGAGGPIEALVEVPAPDDLAYVMFTSGSTGVPKGVMIEHRNVVNTLLHMAADPGLAPGEVMLGVTTASFDLSVPDLFLPLITGATLVMAGSEEHRDATALARLIEAHQPALMQATPSTWRLLVANGWTGAPGMRVVCGGEAYDSDLVRALEVRVAGVWNFYGPTETCVWSVACRLTGSETDPLPLGAPMRGVAVHLLDSRGEPCPTGVRGELAITGAGLARGYLERPDLTDAAFTPCPFPGAPSARMYLTGDLARVSTDGVIRFAGRRDHQVKLHGFRVELGEVEAVLQSLPDIDHAVAVIHEDGERKRIVCYVVGVPGRTRPDPEALRGRAAELLPAQSVPAVVVLLETLPLTANGKVDRTALPIPDERTGVPLGGELEQLVAEVCSDVFGTPVRYADDDLFSLGADSLLVGRMAVRLTGELDLDVAPGLVFRHPTVGGLAQALLTLLLEDTGEMLEDLASTSEVLT